MWPSFYNKYLLTVLKLNLGNGFQYLLSAIQSEDTICIYEASAICVMFFEETFILNSGLRSRWDMIGAKLHLINVENF